MTVYELLNESALKPTIQARTPLGLFLYINIPELKDELFYMSVEYYLSRSTNKTVSEFVQQCIKLYPRVGGDVGFNTILGHAVSAKFGDKWKKIYNSLMLEYEALDTYSGNEKKTGNDSDTTTYNITNSEDGKVGTNQTTKSGNTRTNRTLGYNSPVPVDTSMVVDDGTVVVMGFSDQNTTNNIGKKTGTESKTFGINETIVKSGRDRSGADILRNEIDFRMKYLLYNTILEDIDSMITLLVYSV